MNDLEKKVNELEAEIKKLKENSNSNSSSNNKSKRQVQSPYFGIILVSIIIAVAALLFYLSSADFKGHIRLENSAWGNFNTDLQACHSGAAYFPQFFGVQFLSKDGLSLKVQGRIEEDAEIFVWKENIRTSLVFKKENCSRFFVQNKLARVKVNGVQTMSGKIQLECTGLKNEKLNFDAEYDQCR